MSKILLHTVLIEKLVPGGFGLGRLTEGIVVLVRYVLPGEKVQVQESKRKKQFIYGKLTEILESSPDRKEPPCPLFGDCGGCNLQHTHYNVQLRLKREMLLENLQRPAGKEAQLKRTAIEPVICSPEEFGYRQRIRLHIDDAGRFGFYHADSHVLVPASTCLLAHPKINEVLKQLGHAANSTELLKHSATVELLYNPAKDDVIMLLGFKRKPRPMDRAHARHVQDNIKEVSLVAMQVSNQGIFTPQNEHCLPTPPHLSQSLPADIAGHSLSLSWEAGGFCQVNLQQNFKLIKLVQELAKPDRQFRVLDLYCGLGNFSLPIALHGTEILGLEGQGSAIRSARRNAELAGITNCSFEKTPILNGVQQLIASRQTFHTILIDPPRQGAAEIMSLLPELQPKQIIYISCNPSTLARDLALLDNSGYELSRLIPIDMFPQTHHLECVALLERKHL